MHLTGKQRRALAAQAHGLKARITLRAEALSDAAIDHVRKALQTRPLLKVRIQTDDRAECDRAAQTLARRIGCLLVQRVGRVVVLYRPDQDDRPAEG